MKFVLVHSLCLLIIAPVTSEANRQNSSSLSFDKMKTLVGKWEGKMLDSGETMPATVEYKLTGGGSALVETLGPGSPYEMVSVFHMDGKSLVMTHYCGSGNQPSMKLKPGKNSNVLFFDFVRGSNMKPGDMHMRQVTFTFDGPDHVKAVWQSYKDSKPAGKASFDFRRVKA